MKVEYTLIIYFKPVLRVISSYELKLGKNYVIVYKCVISRNLWGFVELMDLSLLRHPKSQACLSNLSSLILQHAQPRTPLAIVVKGKRNPGVACSCGSKSVVYSIMIMKLSPFHMNFLLSGIACPSDFTQLRPSKWHCIPHMITQLEMNSSV